MYKVINGKRYNTETAQYIADWDNGRKDEQDYVKETLYKKRTGEFFLHGEGGGMSKYVANNHNNFGYGEKIIPLSLDKAKKWVEEKLDVNDYDRIFLEFDDVNSTVNVLIPESLHERLRNQSDREQRLQKDLIVEALDKYLD